MTDRLAPADRPGPVGLAALFVDVHREASAVADQIDDTELAARLRRVLAGADLPPEAAAAAFMDNRSASDVPRGSVPLPVTAPLALPVSRQAPSAAARPVRWIRARATWGSPPRQGWVAVAGSAAAAVVVVLAVSLWVGPGGSRVVGPGGPTLRPSSPAPIVHTCSSAPAQTSPPAGRATGNASFSGELTYSPDGRFIVTVSAGEDRVFDAAHVTLSHTIDNLGHGPAMSSAFSPGGGELALGRADGSVTVLDVSGWRPLCLFTGHGDLVDGIAYAPDGRTLATASRDGTARIWDAATGRTLHVLTGAGGSLRAVAYSPDGTRLVTVSGNGTTVLWDAADGRRVRTLSAAVSPTDQMTYTVAFAPDGRTVVRGGDSGGLVSWDVAEGRQRLLVPDPGPIYGLAFAPDGGRLVFTVGNDTVHVLDPVTGTQLRSFTAGSTTTVDGVAFSPDGARFATLGGIEGTLRTWPR